MPALYGQSMRIDLDAICGLQISSPGEQVVTRGPELQSWQRANRAPLSELHERSHRESRLEHLISRDGPTKTKIFTGLQRRYY
ncbi:hypothetical protein THAR02_03424 [Trichoderma harzianum]|uniref:Uncharacterized protein n=1 Tax=Trichoderma harzianum TaxID=5544 RepID=A0A0F9XJ28_TRIHA|nr:hypothetical protein THAR02_03424 [Trichoderma harzianum]